MRAVALFTLTLLMGGCVDVGQGNRDTPAPSSQPTTPALETRPGILFETEFGPFTVLLYPESAPKTVERMKDYVRTRYYVGREFTRVVPGHVIQVTDKAGGATDDAQRLPLEIHPDYHFSAGALGIARSSEPDSGGPEFFVMDFATSHLDGNFTIWGQVIDGMSVIHRAARVQAIQSRDLPGSEAVLTDRTAVDAVAITGASLVDVQLNTVEAGKYPMQVAKNLRNGEFRHSLEWPHSLQSNQTSQLTWYVRPYNDTALPSTSNVAFQIGGQTMPFSTDPDAPGEYSFQWRPSSPGRHEASLLLQGQAVATLIITVP